MNPPLIQNVIGDPQIADQQWAVREGLVSFAGYPLTRGSTAGWRGGAVHQSRAVRGNDSPPSPRSRVQIAIAVDRDASERFRELFIGILGHDLRNPLNASVDGAAPAAGDRTGGGKATAHASRQQRQAHGAHDHPAARFHARALGRRHCATAGAVRLGRDFVGKRWTS